MIDFPKEKQHLAEWYSMKKLTREQYERKMKILEQMELLVKAGLIK
jgi:hypothetical protein